MSIPDLRANRSLPLSAFPPSFAAEVKAYLTDLSSDAFDLTKDTPTLRPATLSGNELMIRQIATALVQTGRPASSMTRIADLTDPDSAKAALTVFIDRSDTPRTKRNYSLAYLLLTLARHHVHADEPTLKLLAKFAKNLNPKRSGMTAKNKKRLQQFDDPILLDRLLALPGALMGEARRADPPDSAAARIAAMAVAIELLTVAPIRMKNIAELQIGRTLILDGDKSGYILIDHTETKNKVDLEIPLPRTTLVLLGTYVKPFHPLIATPGCQMLFPNRTGGSRNPSALSTQISRTVARRCGAEMHPHLFRHLAAKVYLEAVPGAYGVIRMLLGHKSIATTINSYCGMEGTAAFRRWDVLITERRACNGPIVPATNRRKGRP